MPLYVYRCEECARIREELFSHSYLREHLIPPEYLDCEECPGRMRKLIAPSSFNLKGSGFHANDYGKSGPKAN
jgi:putative FmdB family regulatory protein